MILDANGRPLTRRIGFTGGLEVERGPRASANLVSLVGSDRVWPEEDELVSRKGATAAKE
jgi:hypothetical protein